MVLYTVCPQKKQSQLHSVIKPQLNTLISGTAI